MQRRQKPPEGTLRRQLQDLQDPGEHRVVRHKAQVIQAGKAHIQGQHHPQQELVDRHDSRDASHGQGFFYQLLKSQFLQHRGHWEQAAIGSKISAGEVESGGSPDFIGVRLISLCPLWGAGFLAKLWTTLNHLGGSWKSAHEGANFAASLFYDRISRVSKWSFSSVVSDQLRICA